jgi:hypothetical protein
MEKEKELREFSGFLFGTFSLFWDDARREWNFIANCFEAMI